MSQPTMARLDPLLDEAPCSFVSFADDGRIVLVNTTLLCILGYERDELIGRHLENVLNVGTRVFYQTHLFPLVRLHGVAEEIFLMLRSKTGEDIAMLANVVRRERDGAAAYDAVLMRVRERQKYEEELLRARRNADQARAQLEEQAVELEAMGDQLMSANEELIAQTEEARRLRAVSDTANRAKSDFLAVMSHELRTPLNAISGYVQLLEMEIQGPLTEKQRDVLVRVDRSQRHLLRLINQVLNLSKLEAGGIDYVIEDVPLTEIVDDVMPMVEPQIAEKGLRLEVAVPAGLRARADREKVEQIVINLLSNAVKFTPSGGSIALRAAPADDNAGIVVIDVSDTGIGIPAEKLAAVFEPFVQVHATGAGSSQGTGLGLAISRDLARGMSGELTVASEEGKGSTFTLTLPRG